MSRVLADALKKWLETHPGGFHTFCMADQIAHSKSKRNSPSLLTGDEENDHLQRILAKIKWNKIKGWHCYRRSFVSILTSLSVDQRMIDAWVGHQSEEMRRRYRHLFPDKQQETIKSVFG